MPLLSRVLHPASKRKPALHSQGMVSPSISRSNRRGPQCSAQARLDTQGTAAQIRRPTRKSSSYMQCRDPTFSELYPLFRSLLEKRHLATHYPNQHTYRRAVLSLPRNSDRARSATTPVDSLPHNQLRLFVNSWESSTQVSSRRAYSTWRGRSATIPANFQPSLNLPRRTTPIASSGGSLPNIYNPHRSIPFRSVSHQSSTRLFEEIISTPRIQDDYLSIMETSPPPPRPSSPGVIKEWIVSQLSLAREHFKRQNYMQALGIIEKARDHDYVSMLTTFPKYSASARQSRWHLQDLALVEYCCKLAYVHESQIGNVDIVETVNQLNSAILAPVGDFKAVTAPGFRTSFLKQNDPLVDHTLAIIMRNRTDSWNGLGMVQMSENGAHESTEHTALATALRPFLQAVTARQLFPSSTSLLLDTAAVPVPDSPRRMVLEACLIAGDDRCTMDWIKLWNRRDRSDWLQFWSNAEFKHSVARSLYRVGKVDRMIDVVRISHDSKINWLQDLLSTLAATQSEALEPPTLSLAHLFELMDLDSTSSHHKTVFYRDLKMGRKDLMESWIVGARAIALTKVEVRNQAEHDLWNELAMVGVLAKDLTMDDVLRSVKQVQPRTEHGHHQDVNTFGSRIDSGFYSDSLTLYLESIASSSNFGSTTRNWHTGTNDRQCQTKSRPQAVLAQAIQNLMSRHDLTREYQMTEYKNLLLDVTLSITARLHHRGLLSQVSESKFMALHGKESWMASVSRSTAKHDARLPRDSIDLENSAYRGNVISFAEGSLMSDLSKWCAASVAISGSSKIKWEGRFSDWFMDMAESSPRSGPMARAIQFQGMLDPASGPYQIALWALIKDREYDLAAALHSNAYRLFEKRDPTLEVLDAEPVARTGPSAREVGMLVSALAKSDQDPKHLLQAQSILDRHLEIECNSAGSHPPIDIQTVTELAGAWSRRAKYVQLRHVLETMRHQEIQPNMIFYNTLLKSLVDLAPLLRDGARTFGSGSGNSTRELGRDLMVRQLLRSRNSAPRSDTGMIEVRSELQEGWEIFQSLVSRRPDRPLRLPTLSGQGMDSPTALKSLVLDPELSQDSSFSPDAFTFSILLGAFARRGEIEPISELFVEMKELGIEPDKVICTILANAFAKRGDLRSVDRVLQEARSRRMEPGLPLYNMILDSLVEMNAPVASIRDALDRMIAKFGSHDSMDSDEEVEIPVRRQDLKSSRFHPSGSDAQDRAGTTTTRRRGDSNSTLDAVTMTTLIKYHARQDDLQSAQDIFDTMVQAGLIPGQHVYVHLIAACIRKRDVESGVSIIRTMKSESGLQADAKAWKGLFRCALDLEAHAVDWSRPYRPPMSNINHTDSDSLKKSRPVSVVLQELFAVIEELMQSSENDVKAKDGTNVAQDYLRRVLTSSWITIKDTDEPSIPLSRKRDPIKNSEVKGKNGLLRRLLDHLLRDSEGKKSKPSTDTTKGVLTSPSIPRPRRHKRQPIGDVDESSEVRQDLQKRCELAIQLVRLIEETGTELGPQWKRDVVVRRVQSLTGEDSASILKRLQPRTLWRRILKDSL